MQSKYLLKIIQCITDHKNTCKTELRSSPANSTAGFRLFTTDSLVITFVFTSKHVVWIIGLNWTCLLILLVFAMPRGLCCNAVSSTLITISQQLGSSVKMLQAIEMMGEKEAARVSAEVFSVGPLQNTKTSGLLTKNLEPSSRFTQPS